MLDRGKSGDAVDFEVDRPGGERPDAGDPQEPLNLGTVEESRANQPLELADLVAQQRNLRGVQGGLGLIQRWQPVDGRDIEFLEQPVHTVLAARAALDQPEPGAQPVARRNSSEIM